MDGLQKHYGALGTSERLAILLRAVSRGDTQEQRAVSAASPRRTVTMADIYPHLCALEFVSLTHYMSQIDLLLVVTAVGLTSMEREDAMPMARYLARRYVVAERAFHLVCEEIGFDYDAHTAKVMSAFLFDYGAAVEVVRETALTDEECEGWAGVVPGWALELPAPPTVEEVTCSYREALAAQVDNYSVA